MRFVALVLVVMSPSVGAAARVPGAAGGGAAGGGAGGGAIWANVQFTTPPSPGGSDGNGCRWRPARPHDAGLGQSGEVVRTVAGVVQRLYERSCSALITLVWVSQPTPGRLGEVARDVVIGRLPAPVPRTAPPPDLAVVNSALWFWTDPSVWRETSVTAWVPTPTGVLWSRTTARPAALVFAPGEPGRSPVTCPGPGRPWQPIDGDELHSPCSVTYLHDSSLAPAGRFPAVLGIDWVISWTSSTGHRGSLPGHRTTTARPIGVREIQALVTTAGR